MADPFKDGLERREANFQPLTPLVFLARAADVKPDHTAIIQGYSARTYAMFYRQSLIHI